MTDGMRERGNDLTVGMRSEGEMRRKERRQGVDEKENKREKEK